MDTGEIPNHTKLTYFSEFREIEYVIREGD